MLVKKAQRGTTLVELMIGIVIALIILGGVLTVMLRISLSGADTVQATRLNQQARGGMDFMVKELQRAGYVDWFSVADLDDDGVLDTSDDSFTGDSDSSAFFNLLDIYQSAMPSVNRFGSVALFDSDGNACNTDCSCVLYSYDLDEDGLQGVGSGATPGAQQDADNFELFGLRLNSASGRIEMLTAGDHSCTAGTWEEVTDSTITVTALELDLVYVDPSTTTGDATIYSVNGGSSSAGSSCTVSVTGAFPDTSDTVCLQRRMINIGLQAQLASNADVSASLSSSVKLKNDFLQTQ